MFKKILVATDGSDDAVLAARTAAELASQFGSQVILLTVYTPPILAAEAATFTPTSEEISDIQSGIIEYTAAPLKKLNVPYDSRAAIGHAAATIISVADQERSDLIVLGSHGVGGIRRFLLGSVSDRVGHYASCAVLIVKREHHR